MDLYGLCCQLQAVKFTDELDLPASTVEQLLEAAKEAAAAPVPLTPRQASPSSQSAGGSIQHCSAQCSSQLPSTPAWPAAGGAPLTGMSVGALHLLLHLLCQSASFWCASSPCLYIMEGRQFLHGAVIMSHACLLVVDGPCRWHA